MLWRFDHFNKVMKLQTFESGVSDVIPANLHDVSSLYFIFCLFCFALGFFCLFFVNFIKKEFCTIFGGVYDHFLHNYQSIDCLDSFEM